MTPEVRIIVAIDELGACKHIYIYIPMHIYYRRCVAFTVLRKVTMRYNITLITSNLVTSKNLAGGRQQCVLHRKQAFQCLKGPRGFKIFCKLSF